MRKLLSISSWGKVWETLCGQCREMREVKLGVPPGLVSRRMSLRKPLGSRKGSSWLDARACSPASCAASAGVAAPNCACGTGGNTGVVSAEQLGLAAFQCTTPSNCAHI